MWRPILYGRLCCKVVPASRVAQIDTRQRDASPTASYACRCSARLVFATRYVKVQLQLQEESKGAPRFKVRRSRVVPSFRVLWSHASRRHCIGNVTRDWYDGKVHVLYSSSLPCQIVHFLRSRRMYVSPLALPIRLFLLCRGLFIVPCTPFDIVGREDSTLAYRRG